MTPTRHSVSRASVLLLGGFAMAAIATSPARWLLQAQVPPTSVAPSQALLVTIESPGQVEYAFRGDRGPIREWVRPEASVVYVNPSADAIRATTLVDVSPGRMTLLGPEGASLDSVLTQGTCTSGGFCSPCNPPAGSSIRIASLESTSVWKQEARTAAPPFDVLASAYVKFYGSDTWAETHRFEVEVESKTSPHVEASVDDGELNSQFQISGYALRRVAKDRWRQLGAIRYNYGPKRETPGFRVQWTVTASTRGPCSGTPCLAPTSPIRIVGIERASQ